MESIAHVGRKYISASQLVPAEESYTGAQCRFSYGLRMMTAIVLQHSHQPFNLLTLSVSMEVSSNVMTCMVFIAACMLYFGVRHYFLAGGFVRLLS